MKFPAPATGPWMRRVTLGLLLITMCVIPVAFFMLTAPAHVGYVLTTAELRMEAKLGPLDTGKSISRADIRGAAPITLGAGRRVAGTGRGDLCSGHFRYADIGDVWQATTCGASAVRLDTADGVVVVTPADAPAFIAAVTTHSTGEFPAAQPLSSGRAPPWVVPLLVLAGVGGVLAFRRGTRPLVYEIVGSELIVPAHLRSVRVSLSGATVERRVLSRAIRLAGTGLPGFRLGHFWSDVGRHHVAATDLSHGLLVRGARMVYITPEDVEGFLAAAKSAGATVVPAA